MNASLRLLPVVVATLLVACRSDESSPIQPSPHPPTTTPKIGSPVARGTLKRAKVKTGYGIAVPAGSDMTSLERLARAKAPNGEVSRTSLANIFSAKQMDFVLQPLAQPDIDGLKASAGVILLRGSDSDAMKLARELAGAARDVADAAHGWVLDAETLKIYTALEFYEHVPGEHPDVRKLIMLHSVIGGDEQPFVDTAGMHRYGFPELYVSEASTGEINQVMNLMNGAAQMLLDTGDVTGRGEIEIDFRRLGWDVGVITGTGKAVLKTRWAKERDSADDDALVVELVPPSGQGIEGTSKLIDECFGHEPEQIANLKEADPDLMAAAVKARADLVKLRPHFAHGLPVDERLTVKAKFTGDEGQVEWMWVDVVAFKGDSLLGTLANDPQAIKSLHDGQKVQVDLADVADYLHEREGNAQAGGYSIEVMKKRGLLPSDAKN